LQINGGELLITFRNAHTDAVVGDIARGASLLHFASHRVIPYLISCGVDPNYADAEGRTPFYVKSKTGCIASMQALLLHGQNVDINAQTAEGKSALLMLLVKMASSPRTLEFVKNHPFDPEQTYDEDGWSVLFYAAVLGSVDICRVLIQKGASADVADAFGNYPFLYALVAHNCNCASLLINHKSKFPPKWVPEFSSVDNISIITRKVKTVFKGIYKNLYEPVEDADDDEEPYLTASRQPLLHLTLSHGFLHSLEDPLNTLVTTTQNGRPSFTLSRVRMVCHLLQTILLKGYDPNVRSLRNETALGLLLSVRSWRQGLDVTTMTLLLLRHGADATMVDSRGRNLLDLTLRVNDLEIATYVFLSGTPLKPRHRDKIREIVGSDDPHTPGHESPTTGGCPYASYQPCLSCLVNGPLSLKDTARIVIRRCMGSKLAYPELTRGKLRLPRELHRFLYMDDIAAARLCGQDLPIPWEDWFGDRKGSSESSFQVSNDCSLVDPKLNILSQFEE